MEYGEVELKHLPVPAYVTRISQYVGYEKNCLARPAGIWTSTVIYYIGLIIQLRYAKGNKASLSLTIVLAGLASEECLALLLHSSFNLPTQTHSRASTLNFTSLPVYLQRTYSSN